MDISDFWGTEEFSLLLLLGGGKLAMLSQGWPDQCVWVDHKFRGRERDLLASPSQEVVSQKSSPSVSHLITSV